MRILYFARIRQIVGRAQDEIEMPAGVQTVSDLIDFLAAGDEGCAAAFADRRTLRAAVNKSHVQLDASIVGAVEVAFFPPVTGG
ncbi:MAG: molybdopterin converting factor subunit 1 [Rhizobiales bacterium]|nr:molybdopterin converting factor subunit 1 [Hyphomicrobiales bacterium]MBI3673915.1 molybdopterin converting factor subunit 1 [Hyphomicrobiales bacterium]